MYHKYRNLLPGFALFYYEAAHNSPNIAELQLAAENRISFVFDFGRSPEMRSAYSGERPVLLSLR